VCLGSKAQVAATHVARDDSGLEWFECGNHEPDDNVAGTMRISLIPLEVWYHAHGLTNGGPDDESD